MSNYFFTDVTGQKTGPFTVEQLRELAAQGVITPHTPMETDTGRTGMAGQIPGLFATAQAQTTAPTARLFCTNCGNPVAEQAVACMACGATPVGHRRFCRHCGTALNAEQVVCVRCGAAINTVGAYGAYQPISTSYGVSDNSTTLLVCSIFMTLCCCLPAGVVGIIFSILSKNDYAAGNYDSAATKSKIAFWCLIGGLIGGIIIFAIYFCIGFMGAM